MGRPLLFACLPLLALPALACGGASASAGGTGAGTTGYGGSATGGSATTGYGGSISTGTGGSSTAPCPATASPGTPCTQDNATCTYGDSVLPDCREVVTCTGGTWTASHSACSPQSPACPSDPPVSESTCSLDAGVDTPCGYSNGQICVCSQCAPGGGTCVIAPPSWHCGGVSGPAACPVLIPNEGAACTGSLTCTYSSPGCGMAATCTGSAWVWMPLACAQ